MSYTIVPSGRLQVKKIPEPPIKRIKIDELLPQPPFLLNMVAARKSGKTNLLVDLLTDVNKFSKKFDVIFIWSKSFYNDDKWKKLGLDKKYVRNDYNEKELNSMIKNMEKLYEEIKFNVLLVFDDMIDQKIMNVSRLGAIETVAVRGRHFGCSVVIVSQLYKKLSGPIRVNATNTCVFRIRNNKELKKITEENQECLTDKEFMAIYRLATDVPFGFLHINAQDPDPMTRFRKNWSDIIKLE